MPPGRGAAWRRPGSGCPRCGVTPSRWGGTLGTRHPRLVAHWLPPSRHQTQTRGARHPLASRQEASVRAALPQPVLSCPGPRLPPLGNGLVIPFPRGHRAHRDRHPGTQLVTGIVHVGASAAPSPGVPPRTDAPELLSHKMGRAGRGSGGLECHQAASSGSLAPTHLPCCCCCMALTPSHPLSSPCTPSPHPHPANLMTQPSPPSHNPCKPPGPYTPPSSQTPGRSLTDFLYWSPLLLQLLALSGPWGTTQTGGGAEAPRASGSPAALPQGPGCVGPAASPRDTPLWSLPLSTAHLSSVSSSLRLPPSFLGFSEGGKVGGACPLSPGASGWGQTCSGGRGWEQHGGTHSAPLSLRLFPARCPASEAWEAGSNSPLRGGKALMRRPRAGPWAPHHGQRPEVHRGPEGRAGRGVQGRELRWGEP